MQLQTLRWTGEQARSRTVQGGRARPHEVRYLFVLALARPGVGCGFGRLVQSANGFHRNGFCEALQAALCQHSPRTSTGMTLTGLRCTLLFFEQSDI